MNKIEINNITDNDVNRKSLRILKDQKLLFPNEISGQPKTYNLNFKISNCDYVINYRIGSKDGKSRSGVLKLGLELFDNILKIRKGSVVVIKRSVINAYEIEKVK